MLEHGCVSVLSHYGHYASVATVMCVQVPICDIFKAMNECNVQWLWLLIKHLLDCVTSFARFDMHEMPFIKHRIRPLVDRLLMHPTWHT
jgi:hypothetical protein